MNSYRHYIFRFWTVFVGLAFAQQPADSTGLGNTPTTESLNIGWVLAKTIGSLVLIIVLIFVVVYLLKRFWGKQYNLGSGSGFFRILARIPIDPKQSLALVKVYNRVLLIGISESSISLITEFDREKELDQILADFPSEPSGALPDRFRNLMRKQFDK